MNWTNQDLKNHLKKKNQPVGLFPETERMIPHIDIYNELVDMVNGNTAIFIGSNVPSLKNGKQIFQMNTGKSICCNAPYKKMAVRQYKCTECGVISSQLGKRATLVPSESHKKYTAIATAKYIENAVKFNGLAKELPFPLYVGMYFIRSTERDFDIDNAFSTVMDLIKNNGWISEDIAKIIYPVALGDHVDKHAQGLIITILNERPKYSFNKNYTGDSPKATDDLLNTI